MDEPTVAEVMSRQLITASPDTSFRELVGLTVAHGVGGLPIVTSEGHPSGVVLASDLTTKLEFRCGDDRPFLLAGLRRRRRWRKSRGLCAADLMTPPTIVKESSTARTAAHQLAGRRLRMICVVDTAGYLVGVVTAQDLVRLLLRSDAAIHDAIGHELIDTVGKVADRIAVRVVGGVVVLAGTVPLRSTTLSVSHAVHRVPGVVAVDNNLHYETDDLMVSGF